MLDIDADVASLSAEIKRLGKLGPDGKTVVKYGVLFRETGDVFEALMGTLRAAKKRAVVDFQGQLLLQGVHDDVDVVLLPEAGAAGAATVAAAVAAEEADGEKKKEEEAGEEPAAVAAAAPAPAVVSP